VSVRIDELPMPLRDALADLQRRLDAAEDEDEEGDV
jgi:hypothetical protein